MTLGEIIKRLAPVAESHPDAVIRHAFDPDTAHSWRGDYFKLSFDPAENVRLADMVAALFDAIGETYDGYKGGEYTMHETTAVYMDEWGTCSGNAIGSHLVEYWIEEVERQTSAIRGPKA